MPPGLGSTGVRLSATNTEQRRGRSRLKTIPLLEPLAADLERVEEKMREPVHLEHRQFTAVLNHLLDSGGKRLRPALALLAGRLYQADTEKLVSLAAALELLHTATLVHDDLVDGALLRRGNVTLNAQWSAGATVLTGDYLFARAAALATETGDVRVVAIFANTLTTICSGELRQIFDRRDVPYLGSGQAWEAALERYEQRIHAKTASLFAAATEAAAVLGQASEDQMVALRNYGRFLGMGFQIVDDVLDFQGDQAVLGKPVGSDLREGIVTLPVLYFLRDNPNDERVVSVIRDGADADKVREVVAAIQASGALEEALQQARTLAAQSQSALRPLPEGQIRSILNDLADYSVARQQ